jgi:flagellum-specific peptidoglycan hydrolase FlgJ
MPTKNNDIIILGGLAAFIYFASSYNNAPAQNAPPTNQPIDPNKYPYLSAASTGIANYTSFAQLVASTYGIPVDTTLGEAGGESAWFTSDIFKLTNNAFGIEADASWAGDIYQAPDGTKYRKYPDVESSFMDYGKFLTSNSRYQPAFDLNTVDPIAFGQAIAAAGYAEDPNYSSKLTSWIKLVQQVRG